MNSDSDVDVSNTPPELRELANTATLDLSKADENNYKSSTLWLHKLCLIIGIAGACRRDELRKITTKDIVYQSNMLVITIPDSKNGKRRVFTVTDKLCDGVNPLEIFRQYANLRPKHCNHNIIFVNYKSGKCTVQVVGVQTFAKIPSLIAKYLKLPNELEYTGHCYRRTSATLLVNVGADMLSLKQHGGWKSSTVAEGYIEDSIPNKINVSKSILTGQALREGSFRKSDAGASASEVPINKYPKSKLVSGIFFDSRN